ncbi:c-type cytochrome biogenesis protein CcmI [Hahella sp. HN01]|uniref:c-type cytochrome biogenesis protein CcmI n=1 Tax=Hahella sp. HN01 TaxID=2847262 RepID=UPI001C1EB014|nr:c-type cytochrome biogenesis protein CcmI [Hahella sp. HN01]MBU6955011.1 c-type cytochrome biogenesis protein CcmI [Hahella sp. HN01]
MTVFWLAIVLLAVLAIAIIAVPLLSILKSGSQGAGARRDTANVALFEDRLTELRAELKAGQISDAEFHDLHIELEKSLLNDAEPGAQNTAYRSSRMRQVLVLVLVVVGVPVTALLMYQQVGDYKGLRQVEWMKETRLQLALAGNDPEEILRRLRDRLLEQPDHVEGWALLGRSLMTMQRYAEAEEAFRHLAELLAAEGENPAGAHGLRAQALFFKEGRLSAPVRAALEQALKTDPNEGSSLSILGVAAFQEQRYAEAAKFWRRIIELNPNDPNAAAIRNGVARAEQLAAEQANQQPAQAAGGASLQLQVSLGESLNGQAEPGDTVFILARPADGTRMPLAVVRKTVGELPVSVTLDDSMAMGPMAKLSSAETVEVVARVSKSGSPQPQPGDLQGVVGPIQLRAQNEPLNLVIDQLVQ